jgi:hypothetical protein
MERSSPPSSPPERGAGRLHHESTREEPGVAQRERPDRLASLGWKLLLIGGVMAAIGLALAYPLEGVAQGIGVMLASLAVAPTVAGIVAHVVARVQARALGGKPFA